MFTFGDACPLGFADVRGSVCQRGGSGLHNDWVWRLCHGQAFSILPWVEDHVGSVEGCGGGMWWWDVVVGEGSVEVGWSASLGVGSGVRNGEQG